MADAKPTPVTVTATQWHTHQGKEYPEGATYEVDAATAESLIVQGKAVRAEDAPPAEKTAPKGKK
jgi:hypothetical protein